MRVVRKELQRIKTGVGQKSDSPAGYFGAGGAPWGTQLHQENWPTLKWMQRSQAQKEQYEQLSLGVVGTWPGSACCQLGCELSPGPR